VKVEPKIDPKRRAHRSGGLASAAISRSPVPRPASPSSHPRFFCPCKPLAINSVKPSQTKSNHATRGGDSLSPQHSPLPPGVHGPRLWQSPTAALHPAIRANLNEASRNNFALCVLCVSVAKTRPVQPSPTQSNSVKPMRGRRSASANPAVLPSPG